MAPGEYIDVESSTEIPIAVPLTSIPDDIFQAALAASEHDSDGEDPYGPQPKRFMQTEHQKREQKRALEIRRVTWTIRKMREPAKHQRLKIKKKQKQRPSPFQKLPTDLVLKLMQHTHSDDRDNLSNSSAKNQSIFRANEKAVFRGIEIEQFPKWKWLFGDSKERTMAQSQHLKDAIISENYDHNSGACRWAYDKQPLELLGMVDNNEFTGPRNVKFLQDMQDRIDEDIEATKMYFQMNIARRTAICLRCLSFQRPGIVNGETRPESRPSVKALEMPWEARSQLINEQPASIRAEVRSILQTLTEKQYFELQEVLRTWASRHYSSDPNHRKPQEVKKWMAKLVTGLVLEAIVPLWRAETPASSLDPVFLWESCFDYVYLPSDLEDLMSWQDKGNFDAIEEVKNGVEFGRSIGMDVEGFSDRVLPGLLDGIIDVEGDGEDRFAEDWCRSS